MRIFHKCSGTGPQPAPIAPQQSTTVVRYRFRAQRGYAKNSILAMLKMINLAKFQVTKLNVHFGGRNRPQLAKKSTTRSVYWMIYDLSC